MQRESEKRVQRGDAQAREGREWLAGDKEREEGSGSKLARLQVCAYLVCGDSVGDDGEAFVGVQLPFMDAMSPWMDARLLGQRCSCG
eukprot:485736-Rhodomonas_salina.1